MATHPEMRSPVRGPLMEAQALASNLWITG